MKVYPSYPQLDGRQIWHWKSKHQMRQYYEGVFYIYGSVHHNIFYEITNRCSYMQSILFHC